MAEHLRDRISALEAKQEAYHEAQVACNEDQNDKLDKILGKLETVAVQGESIRWIKRYVHGLATALVAGLGYLWNEIVSK